MDVTRRRAVDGPFVLRDQRFGQLSLVHGRPCQHRAADDFRSGVYAQQHLVADTVLSGLPGPIQVRVARADSAGFAAIRSACLRTNQLTFESTSLICLTGRRISNL